MATADFTGQGQYFHPDDPAGRLAPGEPFMVDGLDWSWAYVWYKEVPGIPCYCAGTNGTIWSRRLSGSTSRMVDYWRILKPVPHSRGYLVVSLGRGHQKFVNWIILETFVGPRVGQLEACHNNGIRTDNRLVNVRWDSRSGNFSDKLRHGTDNRGSKHGHAKLTDDDVIEIRRLRSTGMFYKEIGLRFHIDQSTARQIATKARWGHL